MLRPTLTTEYIFNQDPLDWLVKATKDLIIWATNRAKDWRDNPDISSEDKKTREASWEKIRKAGEEFLRFIEGRVTTEEIKEILSGRKSFLSDQSKSFLQERRETWLEGEGGIINPKKPEGQGFLVLSYILQLDDFLKQIKDLAGEEGEEFIRMLFDADFFPKKLSAKTFILCASLLYIPMEVKTNKNQGYILVKLSPRELDLSDLSYFLSLRIKEKFPTLGSIKGLKIEGVEPERLRGEELQEELQDWNKILEVTSQSKKVVAILPPQKR